MEACKWLGMAACYSFSEEKIDLLLKSSCFTVLTGSGVFRVYTLGTIAAERLIQGVLASVRQHL